MLNSSGNWSEHLKHARPPHRHPTCKLEHHVSRSHVFQFDPLSFGHARVHIDGAFSKGTVSVHQGRNEDDIQVNVTVHANHKKLLKQVTVSSFDSNGQYNVEAKRAGHSCPKSDACVTFHVDIALPTELKDYESLAIHARHGEIEGQADTKFQKLAVGVGHGSIHFEVLSRLIKHDLISGDLRRSEPMKSHWVSSMVLLRGSTKHPTSL